MSHQTLALSVLVGLFIALAGVYSWVTPLFEAPDETWHFWYVKHLADGGDLPVVTPGVRAPWRQEGTQPPLYYWLAAQIIRGVDTSDAPSVVVNNPYTNVGRADLPGNRNAVVPISRSPLQGTALAAQLVRWLSVALGAVTVLATYGLAREVFPSDPLLPLAAAAVVAFNPQFLFLSGSINNDNLIVTAAALGLWRLVHWLRRPPTWYDLVILGGLGGLAALAKLSGLALIGFICLAVSLRALGRRSLRDLLAWNAVLVALPLLLAGWVYWRNFQLYGDPLAVEVHLEVSGRRNPRPSLLQLVSELESVRRSFWAVFGWFNVTVADWVYALYDALSLAALVGVGVGVWRWWPSPASSPINPRVASLHTRFLPRVWGEEAGRGMEGERSPLPYLLLLAAWAALVFVSLVRWMSLIKAAQGRLLFPALAALAVLGVWGLGQLAPRWRGALWGGVVAVMVVIAVLIPPLTIAPAYAPPSLIAPEQVNVSYRTNVDFGGQMRLLGYDLGGDARPGDLVPLTLCWQALQPMAADYTVFAQLVGGPGDQEARIAGIDTYPGLGSFPTRRWTAGAALCDEMYLPIGAKVETPRSYGVIVGVYDRAQNRRLPATRDGQAVGDVVALGSLFVRPADPAWTIPQPMQVTLGDAVDLMGYEVSSPTARPGETVTLTLYWRARQPLPADYTVFVHLGDAAPLVAQADGPPLAGRAPTSSWRPGQTVRDERRLVIRPDAAPGDYPLRVGLYLSSTGARLPVTAGGSGDSILLGSIQVR